MDTSPFTTNFNKETLSPRIICFSFGNKSYKTPPHFQHRDGKKSSLIRIEFFFFLNDEKS